MGKNRKHLFRNPIAFLCLVITACSSAVIILSFLRLPETQPVNESQLPHRDTSRIGGISEIQDLGFFGEIIVDMLPQDLAFTAFVPSDAAFSRDLGLNVKTRKRAEIDDNTYATLSRVLGFSVVPRRVVEGDLAAGETVSYESLSGLRLEIERRDGLVVNGVKTEKMKMGLRRGMVVVYVMEGVIMDAEFAQSIDLTEEEDEQEEQQI